MPIRIYVMADHRAVPDSYLHVEINEAAIDWIGGGANYAQVLSGGGDDSAPMTLLLDDGRIIDLGPSNYRGTATQLVADLQGTPALFVHDLAGQTDALIADFSIDAQEDIENHNAAQPTWIKRGRGSHHVERTRR